MSRSDKQSKGCLIAVGIWVVLALLIAVGFRFLIKPKAEERLAEATGSASRYDHTIRLAADSFSGYCLLRSQSLAAELGERKIKLDVIDDGADYSARLQSLRDGQTEMAAFTIDSLIAAGAEAGEFPCSIVMVLDETSGGDAIVARRSAVPNLQALNNSNAGIVLTPASPSEFLSRVVIAHFNLPQLPRDWQIDKDGAAAVYDSFKASGKAELRAYAMWEPYVSMALQEPDAHVLIDSSKLEGYIVDVLVARREFLRDEPKQVKAVVESYLRAAFATRRQTDGLTKLVQGDAVLTGSPKLTAELAAKVVAGVRWKNTVENYAHFGLTPPTKGGDLKHLEDVIDNIIEVQMKTGILNTDPLPGKRSSLFYDGFLADLKASDFHPEKNLNLLKDVGPGAADLEGVQKGKALSALSEADWARVQPVGELRVDPIGFLRGSARIGVQGKRDLSQLARRLDSFPQYYLRVVGHTRAEGDADANKRLAESRGKAVAAELQNHGVDAYRLRVEAAPMKTTEGVGQSVSFEVVQLPY